MMLAIISTVSGETTDEELLSTLIAKKQHLAKRLAAESPGKDWVTAEHLTDFANEIAAAEGHVEVAHDFRAMLQQDYSADAIRKAMMRKLLLSPGDTYSGRGNDNRRAKADGVRAAVDSVIERVDRVSEGWL